MYLIPFRLIVVIDIFSDPFLKAARVGSAKTAKPGNLARAHARLG